MVDKNISDELKVLALEMINNAGSGHSGSVLSCLDAIYTLYTRHILTDGTKNIHRDRFVLSNGHSCAALYSVLAGLGYIDFEDIKTFRKFNGKLTGHPEIDVSAVDANTGPLGQGVANAVGLSIAETIMNERFGIDHFTYCMAGDGCLQEGVALEALAVAGLYNLNKFILLYDKNNITLDGELSQSSNDNVELKFKSMNFNVINVDGHNIDKIDKAILKAKQSKHKPTVIIMKTIIGKDTSLENSNKSHGAVYGLEDIEKLKKLYNIQNQRLTLNSETKNFLNNKKLEINQKFNEKIEKFDEKIQKNAEKLKKYNYFINNSFKFKSNFDKEKNEIRNIHNNILNQISKTNENIVTLSADLSSSTKTKINDGGIYSSKNRLGRNIAVGIREHAMGAIANGIALHGGLVPICSTFLVFSNYMLPAIRMAGIMNLPVVFNFSHSSGYEVNDGITHVSVEQLDQLRLIPNVTTFKVYDSAEIKFAYDWFMMNNKPMCLCTSKTKVEQTLSKEDMSCGAYFITNDKSKINIMASGAEVPVALVLKDELKKHNIESNVISMVSLEVFEKQPNKVKSKFLNKPLFVVEASTGVKYLKYTTEDKIFNVNKFGISADSENMKKYFGLDISSIAKKIIKTMNKS